MTTATTLKTLMAQRILEIVKENGVFPRYGYINPVNFMALVEQMMGIPEAFSLSAKSTIAIGGVTFSPRWNLRRDMFVLIQ